MRLLSKPGTDKILSELLSRNPMLLWQSSTAKVESWWLNQKVKRKEMLN
jgi:hypothetical protein